MFRNLSRVHLRGLDSLCKQKAAEFSCSHVGGQLELSQFFSTSKVDLKSGVKEESTLRPLQVGIVNALYLGNRIRASRLLRDLERTKSQLKADDLECILECCARCGDPLFVRKTWRVLEDRKISVNENCYRLSITALCKVGGFDEAFDLLRTAGEHHELNVLSVYNHFLNTCIELQNMHYLNQCVDLMDRQAVGKNETTYTVLLKSGNQNLSPVRAIWKEFTKYYDPTITSLKDFVWSFSMLKDLESAYQCLQYMVELAQKESYMPRLDIPIPLNNEIHLQTHNVENHENSRMELFDNGIDFKPSDSEFCMKSRLVSSRGTVAGGKLKSMHVKEILGWSFAQVMLTSIDTQDLKVAGKLMSQMKHIGLEPSKTIQDAFIKAVITFVEGYESGLDAEVNTKPSDSFLVSLSARCSKALELDLAEALLDMISLDRRVLPFNAFLAATDILDKPERAVRMVSKMKEKKVKLNIRTYELLFSLLVNVNAPYEEGNLRSKEDAAKRVSAIELDMERNDLQHNFTSIKNLLSALGAEGMKHEMLEYLRVADELFDPSHTERRTALYNRVLRSLVEAEEIFSAIEIFMNMKSCGLLHNAATFTIMIKCCSMTRCYRSALQLLSLMMRSGYLPTIATYTALIKNLINYEDFDEAIKLLYHASSEYGPLKTCSWGAEIYNTIIVKAEEKGRIDIIELLVEKMHLDNIQPDSTTCGSVFTAYANLGYINAALEALQVLSLRMISEKKEELQKAQSEFEELIFSESSNAESQILKHFNSDEKLTTALLSLRWCTNMELPASWSPDESSWSKTLSANYRRNSERLVKI